MSGPVPPALDRLSLLEGLKLDGNQLHEGIPAELTRLSRLYVLALGGGNGPPSRDGSRTGPRRVTVNTSAPKVNTLAGKVNTFGRIRAGE